MCVSQVWHGAFLPRMLNNDVTVWCSRASRVNRTHRPARTNVVRSPWRVTTGVGAAAKPGSDPPTRTVRMSCVDGYKDETFATIFISPHMRVVNGTRQHFAREQ